MMSKGWMAFLGVFALVALLATGSYNNMAQKEEKVFKAWGNLESSLQRRYDLIPNLVNTVKGYASHEKQTLKAVIEARASIGKVNLDASQLGDAKAVQAFMAKQSQLQGSMHRLLAVVESYPNLKADKGFLDLQHQLEGTENRINYARNQYNDSVQDFNSTIRSFPASLVNAMFAHLDKKQSFKADEKAKDAVVVDFS